MQLLVEIENTPKDAFEGKRASMNLLDVKQIVEFHSSQRKSNSKVLRKMF